MLGPVLHLALFATVFDEIASRAIEERVGRLTAHAAFARSFVFGFFDKLIQTVAGDAFGKEFDERSSRIEFFQSPQVPDHVLIEGGWVFLKVKIASEQTFQYRNHWGCELHRQHVDVLAANNDACGRYRSQ